MKNIILPIAVILAFSAKGQGFLNLDFESANNLPGNPGTGAFVSIVNALPSWTAYNDGVATPNIYYVSNYNLGSATSIALEGGSLGLSGDFSAGIFADGSISQTGMVPDNADSLEFEAEGPGPGGTVAYSGLSVTLGGQTLSYTLLSQGASYNVYGANIPAGLDGQTESLDFLCQGAGSGMIRLDNIEFSPTGVPEPSECALAGLGAMLFGFVRFRTDRPRRLE